MLQPPIQNVSAAADAAVSPESVVPQDATAQPSVAARVIPQLRVPVAGGALPQPAVNPQFPGVDPGVRLWRVGDPKDTRESIYEAVLQATAKMPPVVGKQYTLQLADPHYAEDDPDFNAEDDKRAMLERRSLSRRLRGTWQLVDNASGQLVSERKATIANVPAILRDGTFLRTGTRYAMGYQQRLRPGIYTRFKNSGEPESHVNAKPKSGRSHRYVLEPETGLFSVHIEHAKIPLAPLLDVLGVSREQVEATWGKELTDKNYAKTDPKALGKFYERFVPKFEQTPEDRADPERMKEKVRAAVTGIELDEAGVEKTLGRPSRNLDADLILRATGKSLRLLQGKEEADDRDNLGFASYHSAADILAERFTNDYGKFRRELLYKAARKGDLNSVPSGALDKYINAAIFRSGLGQTVEDVNPMEIAAAARKITRFGEGGLPDTQSAPAEARDVSPSQFGFIDAVLTPESLRVGIDGVLARNTFIGTDNKLYRELIDGRTGQKIFRSPDQLMRSSVAVGASPIPGFELVIAGGRVKRAREGTADYRLQSMDDTFSDLASLVPMKSAMYGQRAGMGARMSGQAISLANPEAPLVQSGVAGDGDESYEERFGEQMGAIRAKERGRVVEVKPGHITLKYAGGREEKVYLDNNRPGARKTIYHQDPVVEMGQEVEPGQLLVRSNHTDAKGVTALGTNARMALMAWDDAWEDNVVVSRSFANNTKIQQAYRYGVEPGSREAVAKRAYLQLFGNRYKDNQLKSIDDDGVIKPGTIVKENDPLILAVRQRDTAQSRVHRQNKMDWSDTSIRWDHAHEGVVTDVVRGKHGVQVVVKTAKPLEDGDKLAGRFGNKGVIAIKEDNEMPHDEEGRPLDAVISPLAIPSRGNSSFPIEMILGKIAKKTGVPYKIKDFTGEDMREFAEQEALRHGVKDTETVTDPVTGRKIPNVLVGNSFLMVLHHMASSKTSGRGLGKYTGEGAPARGAEEGAQAKRYSGQQLYAGLSHGAYNMSAEATLLRGTRNTDYWSAFMSGESVGEPKVPVQYEAFLNRLRGAGINPVRSGTKTRLMALIDSDVRDLAGDRVVTSSDTVDLDNDMRPIKNGLFDPKLFGDGDRFAAIKLSEPMPNPIFEEPLRRILGVTEKDFRAVVAGRKQLEGYGTGPEGLKKKLAAMDLDVEIRKAREAIGGTRKVARDDAVRRLKYLKGLKETDTNPADLMLSMVPVLPPRLRPISKMANKNGVIVHDANYLYRELMEANDVLSELKGVSDETGDERLAVYDNYKAVVGLTEPNNKELKQRKVKGLLKRIVGDSPKSGEVQRRLLSGNVDTIGRGVIAPDTSLDMDSFGLPERLAFKMYEPYLVRNMVSTGIPRVQAMEHLKARDDVARRALLAEIDKRPVTVSRAPILHKYGDIALKPQLVKGDTIRLNPAVYGPMGADNDGDDQIGKIWALLPNYSGYDCPEHRLRSLTIGKSAEVNMYRESRIPTYNAGTHALHLIDLEDFPHGEFDKHVDGANGPIDFYHAIPGTKVMAYDETTKELVWADVAFYSKHAQREVEIVNLANGMQIITDDDPRAVYGVPLGDGKLELQRATPKDALARNFAVPFAKDVQSLVDAVSVNSVPAPGLPSDEFKLTFDSGYWVGAMAGDGWVDKKLYESVGKSLSWCFHLSDLIGHNAARVAQFLTRWLAGDLSYGSRLFEKKDGDGRYGDTVRHTWNSPGYGEAICKFLMEHIGGLRDANHTGSGSKRLPSFTFTAPEAFRRGVLAGLIDTDGNCSVGNSKEKPQLMLSITSTSLRLIRDARLLCRTLGIHATVGFSKTTSKGNSAWLLTISTVDAKRLGIGNDLATDHKRDIFVSTDVDTESPVAIRQDMVPLPADVRDALLRTMRGSKYAEVSNDLKERLVRCWDAIAKSKQQQGMISRFSAVRCLSAYMELMAWRADELTALRATVTGTDQLAREHADRTLKMLSQVEVPATGTADGKAWAATRTSLYNAMNGMTLTAASRERISAVVAAAKPLGTDGYELVHQWAQIVNNTGVRWTTVESVDKTGEKHDGYDLTVPGYETFVDDQGVVLSNTVNLNLPHSRKAVYEALTRMLPSKMLMSVKDFDKAVYMPTQDLMFGLNRAAQPARTDVPTRYFVSLADAKAAYARGEIDLNTPVKIGRK